jgi:peptide/nickel transport system substrate-binding protein
MREVEVVDTYTARVHMDTSTPPSCASPARCRSCPAAYHAEVGDDGFRTNPIGTGAFRSRPGAPPSSPSSSPSPTTSAAAAGRRLRLEVVPEPSVRYIALLTGDAHASVWPLTAEDASSSRRPGFRSARTNCNSPRFIPLNTRCRSSRTGACARRCSPRSTGSASSTSSRAVSAWWPRRTSRRTTPSTPDVAQYPFDPERARSLLEEAGWVAGSDGIRSRDGQRLSFTCTTISGDQARRPMAELSQIFLRNVGVEMQLAEAPVASILEGLRRGNLEASLFNWTHGTLVDPSPTSTLRSDGGDNFTATTTPRWTADRRGPADRRPRARRPIYVRTQEIYAEDVPALYLHYNQTVNGLLERMQGLPDDILVGIAIHFFGHEYSLS